MGKRQAPANDVAISAIIPTNTAGAPANSGGAASIGWGEPQPLAHRSPIDLRIHGDEIFLSGTFHRWQATASSGPDLDLVSVHMAVDATSPDQLTVDPAEHKLFSFAGKQVTKLGSKVYSAEGAMTTERGERPVDLLIEVPEGHNSFFSLAFVARKDFLGDAWRELIGRAGVGGIDAERLLDPRAGLRALELAAA